MIGPRVLEQMGRTGTLEGYNDGLSATSGSKVCRQARVRPRCGCHHELCTHGSEACEHVGGPQLQLTGAS